MSPCDRGLLGRGEPLEVIASLSFAKDVRVDGENGAGFVAEVFGHLVHGGAESEPG